MFLLTKTEFLDEPAVFIDVAIADIVQQMATTAYQLEKAAAAREVLLVALEVFREVVDALMSAEQSLQTAIAIRDKLVTAYLEVSRMQI